jgi:hypothetical protein
MARLRELASSADRTDSDLPGKPVFQSSTKSLLDASEQAQRASTAAVEARRAAAPAIAEELAKYQANDLPYLKRQIDGVQGKLREVTIAFERRREADLRANFAEKMLHDPALMSDPAECRKAGQDLTTFENQPWFETLPGPARARVLFARAVSEAYASFLEGETVARTAERCRPDLIRSYGLDAAVHERWVKSGKLSPRITAFFEQVRRP